MASGSDRFQRGDGPPLDVELEVEAAVNTGAASVAIPAAGLAGFFRPRTVLGNPSLIVGIAASIALVVEMQSLMTAPLTGTLVKDLGLTTTQATWATLCPLIMGASTLGLIARLGDVYGHRRILLGILCLQMVGNLIAANAGSFGVLAIGRAMVGFTGSQALTLAIMRDRLPRSAQRTGVGVISGIQGVGVAISFMIGGAFLAANAGWQGVFWLATGLNVAALVAVIFFMPESVTRAKVRFDWLGAAGLGLWLTLIDVTISQSSGWGRTSGKTLAFLGAAVLAFAVWITYERHKDQPLVDTRLLVDRRLMPCFISAMGMSFGALTAYIGITTYAQVPAEYYGFGATVLGAGAILLPGCSLMSLLGFYTGHVVNRFGAKVVMICGLAGMVAIFTFWAAFHGSIWVFILGMLWFACALMPVFSAGFTVTITQAPRDSVGIVGGLQQLTSSIGSSLGVAVFTACITAAVIPGTAIPAESGFTHAFIAGAIAAFLGFGLAWTIPRFVGRGAFDRTDEDPVREPKPELVRQPLPTGVARMSGELRFDGRVAIVTGAGRGIGRAHAQLLAARGARVVVNDLGGAMEGGGADAGPAAEVVAEIRAAGGTALADSSDIATDAGATALVQAALDAYGRLEVVVCNAGIIRWTPFEEADREELDQHLAVHVGGTHAVCRAAWPHLAAQGYRRIVTTMSTAVLGMAELTSYGAAKGGIVGLSRALAHAGRPHGIAVNVISPMAATRMARGAGADGAAQRPPELVSSVMAFLAHEDCPVTGEMYLAGGGVAARMFIGEAEGVTKPGLTPEDVRDQWDRVNDVSSFHVPEGTMEDAARRLQTAPVRR